MKTKRLTINILLVVMLALSSASTALAGSVTRSGITLTWPDYPLNGAALASCQPWDVPSANTISLAGLPAGADVTVTFSYAAPFGGPVTNMPVKFYNNVAGGSLVVPVSYPSVGLWPIFNAATGERAIAMAVFVKVVSGDSITKLPSTQWWVRCLPKEEKPGLEGCTPGYWRQPQHLDSWAPTGYGTTNDFETIFGVNASFEPDTLLDALWKRGGGEFALARHAVAGLLNASHPNIDYAYTVAQVIAGVQAAYASGNFVTFKDALDAANNAHCPLN